MNCPDMFGVLVIGVFCGASLTLVAWMLLEILSEARYRSYIPSIWEVGEAICGWIKEVEETMKLLTLITLTASLAAAQTTYSTKSLVACAGAGHSFTWTPQETACPANGPANTLVDAAGDTMILRFSLDTNTLSLEYFAAGATTPTWTGSGTLALTPPGLTQPSGCTYAQNIPCATPGTMSFSWSIAGDSNGNAHSGTYSSNWDSRAEFRWIRQFLIPPTQQLVVNN